MLPRFGRLAPGDVAEKSGPADLVTVADRAAEERLTRRLTRLLPGSVVVGEEAVAADPGLLAALTGPAPVWIVDPIDGTANFVSGSSRFSILVALAVDGELLASWTHAPVSGLMASAAAGGGAYVDGRPVRVRAAQDGLRDLDVVIPQPQWWTAEHRAHFNALTRSPVSLSYLDTGGLAYVELAAGRRGAMVLNWQYPWDHAAGVLLYTQAGGVVTTHDAAAFRIGGGNRLPFVAAPDAATAAALHAALAVPGVSPGEAVAAA